MLTCKPYRVVIAIVAVMNLTACQSLPQSATPTNQGYESPIPVHVSGFTGVRF